MFIKLICKKRDAFHYKERESESFKKQKKACKTKMKKKGNGKGWVKIKGAA
jgi:hypothetical protein